MGLTRHTHTHTQTRNCQIITLQEAIGDGKHALHSTLPSTSHATLIAQAMQPITRRPCAHNKSGDCVCLALCACLTSQALRSYAQHTTETASAVRHTQAHARRRTDNCNTGSAQLLALSQPATAAQPQLPGLHK